MSIAVDFYANIVDFATEPLFKKRTDDFLVRIKLLYVII